MGTIIPSLYVKKLKLGTAKWSIKRGILVGGLVLFAIIFLVLFFKSAGHKRACRKHRREIRREAKLNKDN